MRQLPHRVRRRGALTVEAAVVLPVMMTLLLGLVIGGLGVFRYQQTAALAREAARWASVRGHDRHRETKQSCPTQAEIRQQAVVPLTAGMDATKLSVTVECVNPVKGTVTAWDCSTKSTKTLDSSNRYVSNRIRVTVTYDWTPGIFMTGKVQMKSVCEIPMSF